MVVENIVANKDGEKYLFPFLKCSSESTSCEANAEFTLFMHQAGNHHFIRETISWEFSIQCPMWGYHRFISWKNLFDPANCYVKDNSISIVAMVTAKPSLGI